MNCPKCRVEPLVAIEYEDVEIDYCAECKGIWLDAGEMELLFGNEQAASDFLSIGAPAVVPPGEKPRRCPLCHAKMTKESTSSQPPVTFDHCPKGDGMWFDEGELQSILADAGSIGGDSTVFEFLRGIFSSA